jgi:acetyl esterase/lipase
MAVTEPTIVRDCTFARIGERALLLDLELPADAAAPLPVVVWIYGGGWRAGDKDTRSAMDIVNNALLQRGYALARISHRRSDEAPFPAQLEDCKAAIRWLRAHAATYGLDADHLGVWGLSSGGHLAALLGTTGASGEFEDVGGNQELSSRVQAVCTFAAPFDFVQQQAAITDPAIAAMSAESINQLLGGPMADHPDRVDRANPICYITPHCPPFLILNGDHDGLVPLNQPALLADALTAAGVENTVYIIPGGDHGMGGLSAAEQAHITQLISAFFDRHLKPA